MGVFFGITNYFIAILFYKKYNTLKEINRVLNDNLGVDELTGLLNRRAFDNDIIKIDNKEQYSLVFIDIDNFKDFNNKLGHQTGDKVLKEVSHLIVDAVGKSGRVYRYGGEEIVILSEICNKKNAFKIAEQIRLELCHADAKYMIPLTVSGGIATYPEDGENIIEIIKAADDALLFAKARGKNCIVVYGKF